MFPFFNKKKVKRKGLGMSEEVPQRNKCSNKDCGVTILWQGKYINNPCMIGGLAYCGSCGKTLKKKEEK